MAFDENAVWREPEPEALTTDDVREIIREHDRRLAARLREAAEDHIREARENLTADPGGTITLSSTGAAMARVADMLEADDG